MTRRCLTIFATILVGNALGNPAYAQGLGHPACPSMAAPQLEVYIDADPVREDLGRDIAYITSISSLGHSLHSQVLGLSAATVDAERETRIRFANARRGDGVCASVDKLVIRLRVKDRTVYIAREVQQSPCLAAFVKMHEYKHVEVDDLVVKRSMPAWRTAMRQAIRDAHRTHGASRRQAETELQAKLDAAFKIVFRAMIQDQDRRHGMIDTGGDYEKLATVCNGFARRLRR